MKSLSDKYDSYAKPVEQRGLRDASNALFATVAKCNFATMHGSQVHTLPTEATEKFARGVQALKGRVRTLEDKSIVYHRLYLPLTNKLRKDNVAEIDRQLENENLTKNERLEWEGKREDFLRKDYGAFITILWLMNFDGRDKKRRVVNHLELAAVEWLNTKVRKPILRQQENVSPRHRGGGNLRRKLFG